MFSSKICQWMFSQIHPNTGIKIAQIWSRKSRKKGGQVNKAQLKERLVDHSKKILAKRMSS